MRRLVSLALLAAAGPAFAQTAPIPGTVTAEATEVVRVKPDTAKVYVTASSRNADAVTASEDATEQARKFADGLGRMKVKSLKATPEVAKVAKTSDDRAARGFGGPGGAADATATVQVVVSLSDPDPKALAEAVEKVQREAIKEGLTGGTPDASSPISSRYTADMVKVAYLKQDGLDDLLAAALARATKKATARAAGIADGLGMKLGAVVSAEEVPAGGDPTAALLASSLSRSTAGVNPTAELVEGELVRTVRVRVIYAVGK